MRTVRQLTIANAAFYVALGVTSPFITIYLQDLGASFAQIAWVMTGFTLSGLISAYLCGRLSDIYRTRRPFVIVGLAISVAANLMMPLAQDTMTAGLLRVADGIGLGAYNALTLAMMGDVLAGNPRRGRIMGLFRGLGSLTFAVGALISGWLADHYSIQPVFLVAAASYFTAGVTIWFIKDTVQHFPVAPTLLAGSAAPLAAPVVNTPKLGGLASLRLLPLSFLAGVFFWMLAISAGGSMWPNLLDSLGHSKQTISGLWAFAAAIEFPAMQAAGWLSDRWGRAPLLAMGGFGVAITMGGYAAGAASLPMIFLLQSVRGLAYGCFLANAMVYATEQAAPDLRGTTSGVYNAVNSSGQLSGMFAGGQIVNAFGFAPLYWVVSLSASLSGVAFLLLRLRRGSQLPMGALPVAPVAGSRL